MDIVTILKIVSIVLGALCSTIIPLGISLVAAIKKKKAAKTAAEEAEAQNAMLNAVNGFIEEAENLYKDVDALLKERGGSSGAQKKKDVMTELHAFALDRGYTFDSDYWSGVIDEIVEMTRKVNAK